MQRLIAWIKGEEPLSNGHVHRQDIDEQLRASQVAQEEAAQALDEFERTMLALRRRPFPVSDAMRWRRHDR